MIWNLKIRFDQNSHYDSEGGRIAPLFKPSEIHSGNQEQEYILSDLYYFLASLLHIDSYIKQYLETEPNKWEQRKDYEE